MELVLVYAPSGRFPSCDRIFLRCCHHAYRARQFVPPSNLGPRARCFSGWLSVELVADPPVTQPSSLNCSVTPYAGRPRLHLFFGAKLVPSCAFSPTHLVSGLVLFTLTWSQSQCHIVMNTVDVGVIYRPVRTRSRLRMGSGQPLADALRH